MPKALCESCHGMLSSSPGTSLETVILHHAESCPAELGKIRKTKKKAVDVPLPPEPEPEAPVRRVRKRVVTRL